MNDGAGGKVRSGRLPAWAPILGVYTLMLFVLLPFDGPRWGDGLEFAAVSSHLGVAHPPGYPLFTLLGWGFIHLLPLEPYNAMLVLCRAGLVAWLGGMLALVRLVLPEKSLPAMILALAFAVSIHGQESARAVEVYGITAALQVWTAVFLLRAHVGDDGRRWLLLAGVAQGLALAHQPTALALLPAWLYVAWAIRNQWKWILLAGSIALLIPTILYGSLVVRTPGAESAAQGIYWGAPRSAPALLDIIRGGEYRQFQFLMERPGLPFSAASYAAFALSRTSELLESFGGMLVGMGPTSDLVGRVLLLMLLDGLFWSRKDLRLLSLLAAPAFLHLGFVYTYNIPDIDGYFLAPLTLLLPFLLMGALGFLELAGRRGFQDQEKAHRGLVLLCAVAALVSFLASWRIGKDARAIVAQDWMARLDRSLPENAAIITSTDADIYSLWYRRFAVGERPDLLVYGANFMRMPWFSHTLAPNDRELVGFVEGPPPTSAAIHIERLAGNVIRPLLQANRQVYTTIQVPMELDLLERHFEVVPAVDLLTPAEWEFLQTSGEVNIAPPRLYQIRETVGGTN